MDRLILESGKRGFRWTEKLELSFTEANIDEENRTVTNLCLFYRESQNGRYYSDEAIDDLEELMDEHNNSFLNHAFWGRNVEDFLGTFHNIRRGGDKIFADIKVAQHQWEVFFSLVDAKANDIGFSIDASGEIEPEAGPDGLDLVLSLERLWSTDLVAFPATTKNMWERKEEPKETLISDEELEKTLTQNNKELIMNETLRLLASLGVDVSGLNAEDAGGIQRAVDKVLTDDIKSKVTGLETQAATDKSAIEALEKTVADLEAKNTDLEAKNTELTVKVDDAEAIENERKARSEMAGAFKEAKLPERAITDVFEKTYLGADEDGKAELIKDRLATVSGSDDDIDLGLSREEREAAAKGGNNNENPYLDDKYAVERLKASKKEERGF